ncbi:hypothetical protein EYR41_001778 [Orbilia oligospora]|uniref:G-patch domain-containing protein n=1 Tax=Orbilia oligospora TaxID=2813651 RepID=A0A8H2EFE5_ORBOL|nr:hypothetical protein EYR41_001778 [Orbilia oligospora]
MNAQSYLQSFGWTPGTSLGNPLSHAPSTSTCPSSQRLTKRILISTKNNTLGVGRKQSNLNHADLWWEKAFDVSLKKLDVNKDTSTIPQEKKDVVDNMNLFSDLGGGRGFGGTAMGEGVKKGGGKKVEHSKAPLYRYFVRGQGLEGTITSISTTTTTTTTTVVQTETTILEDSRPNKKRKRDSDNDNEKDTSSLSKSERKAFKSERKQLRAERRAAKTERRRLRTERRAAKEEKRKLKAEKRAKKEAKREAKKAESSSASSDDEEGEEEEEEEKHVQSDSGVDMSQDEASVEEDVVIEEKGKGKDKKKTTKALKETGVDAKKKKKKSDRKAKDGSKKKKRVSST